MLDSVKTSAHVAANDEVLARSILDYYGFSRLTKVRRRHLAKVLGAYRRSTLNNSAGTGLTIVGVRSQSRGEEQWGLNRATV